MQQYYQMPSQNEYSSPQLPPPLVIQSQPPQQPYGRPQYVQHDSSVPITDNNGSPVPSVMYMDMQAAKNAAAANKRPYPPNHNVPAAVARPQLKVQIPSEVKDGISPPTIQSHGGARMVQEGNPNEQNQTPQSAALPSQFAQNLPSPSTFYPEFYQQGELPSPLNYGSTPNSAKSFQWPIATPIPSAQQREYRPSPLAKPES